MTRRFPLAIAAVLCSAGAAVAQSSTAAPASKPAEPPKAAAPSAPKASKVLVVGDKAPALAVKEFVKGEPVTGFEKGKVYVVEFWATWCGPCIRGMPHLTEIQKEYKDKGVTIVSVTTEDERNTLDAVKKMVKDKGDVMGYTVAWDDGRKSYEAYQVAAEQDGIPCAYIVNQDGNIAFIGHPMEMDTTLAEVVAGKHDLKAAAATYAQARKGEAMMDEFKAALRKNPEGAYKIANEGITTAWKDNAQQLNEVAWTIVDPKGRVEKKDLAVAEKAAARAVELTKNKDGLILDTLARVHFLKGDIDKAIELQTTALSLAPAQFKAELQPALDEYKAAKAGKK